MTRLTLAPESSEVRYKVREQLTGRPLPGEAVGSTRAVTGTIVLDEKDAIVPEQSRITADLRTLQSDESRRDNYIQRNTLETSQFPIAEIAVREAPGLPSPLPVSGEATFQLLGNMTVRGVTQPTSWDVTAQFLQQAVTGTATTTIKLTDFNMTPPRAGPVLSIEDSAKLELEFRATRENSPISALPGSIGRPAQTPLSCEPTRADALGPFYKPNAPTRTNVGSGYVLTGTVKSNQGCRPLPAAQLEFWLVNPNGEYDDAHRATMLAGPQGEYRFESNPPLPYAGRPAHIHVRVSTSGARTLVTQHYPQAGQTEALFDLVLTPG